MVGGCGEKAVRTWKKNLAKREYGANPIEVGQADQDRLSQRLFLIKGAATVILSRCML
jgi:hypothetical protein